ncbi:flagella basal body P-ring formation protein FlgA [Novosphingobium album (ex Liu et al. 2023)]|uniref:Flagella basal body P-ring formation protein FlgA n=1 Tax=Novosphingobium album (ex Liu et al. 2023) TaxID=3031130 RepID=A0ABT5WM86_9SPHN|nr:flagella basal body P-ring formation protein FlgA [Novosphingobium album (ex Liu et al. 2023)]MDE8651156.1 flagella basal body P-ring formation protein FlgA [Novosphingobium album (ex Liu et al. 2023)]
MSLALGLIFAAATPFADLDTIDRQVAGFTGSPVGEIGGASLPVDRRLRLQPCRNPLALSWRTQMRESVVVQCPDPGGWRLFVPVRQAAPEAVAGPVINRGDAISISVAGEGFTVSQPGEAMESGQVGAWIRVRPAGAGRTGNEPMRAQIVRPGLVSLPLP